jgi:hypothetical protein
MGKDEQLRVENKTLRVQLQDALGENAILRQKLNALAQRIFGKKSEHLDGNQMEMLLCGIEGSLESQQDQEDSDQEPATKSRKPFMVFKPFERLRIWKLLRRFSFPIL